MITKRAFYSAPVSRFLVESGSSILGDLTKANTFELELSQRNAWLEEIRILKNALQGCPDAHLLLEYSIPRMGKRIDAVVLLSQAIVPIEFKVGANSFDRYARDQAIDYALDLKYFHQQSVEAAHIRPFSYERIDKMENGLLLRADVHRLFDRNLVSVNPSKMETVVSKVLIGTEYEEYAGVELIVPSDQRFQPALQHLEDHYRQSGIS